MVCHTFSKGSGLAGLRIGYGFWQKKNTQAFREMHLGWGMVRSMPCVVEATAALEDSAFISKCIRKKAEGRQILYEGFDNWNIKYSDSATNFVYAIDLGMVQE